MAKQVQDAPPPAASNLPAMRTVTVARGRSVAYHVQNGYRINVDGKSVPNLILKTAVPGEEVEVAAHEFDYLLSRGFIVDPNGPRLPAVDPEVVQLRDASDNPGGYGIQRSGTAMDTW